MTMDQQGSLRLHDIRLGRKLARLGLNQADLERRAGQSATYDVPLAIVPTVDHFCVFVERKDMDL